MDISNLGQRRHVVYEADCLPEESRSFYAVFDPYSSGKEIAQSIAAASHHIVITIPESIVHAASHYAGCTGTDGCPPQWVEYAKAEIFFFAENGREYGAYID